MNRLKANKRKVVIAALVEGNSINSTVRMTGVAKTTILRLIRDLGEACYAYHHEHVRGLAPQRVQTDEIWSFNYCKAKSVAKATSGPSDAGDVWNWTVSASDLR